MRFSAGGIYFGIGISHILSREDIFLMLRLFHVFKYFVNMTGRRFCVKHAPLEVSPDIVFSSRNVPVSFFLGVKYADGSS